MHRQALNDTERLVGRRALEISNIFLSGICGQKRQPEVSDTGSSESGPRKDGKSAFAKKNVRFSIS